MRPRRERGALALVLHTHMPYVTGFGTWPSGEEWLWEAIASCYVPLLELLERGAPLTLSLTPVLCDQLEEDGMYGRFAAFVENVRGATHAEDAAGMRAGGFEQLACELERAWGDYVGALEQLRVRGGDLLAALAPYAQWTSSATHAVLPLLATDVGARLQVRSGISAHRHRFGDGWRGGLWLPECAYAPWLAGTLEDEGVRAVCVELTSALGLGASGHLRPLVTDAGVRLVPIDRQTMSLVWSERGYPASGAYRDYHHHTVHHHNPWSNDGGIYDHARAQTLAREHAADFVARTRARLADAQQADPELPGGGLVVCALDTELLGHWWYEGLTWLAAVIEECTRQQLELVRLDDALEGLEPAPAATVAMLERESSWGEDGDLSTWSGPAVADMAFAARAAELEVVGADERVGETAVRELLALQASDWTFMVTRGLAGPYPRERFDEHNAALARALTAGPDADRRALRKLAVHAECASLRDPS